MSELDQLFRDGLGNRKPEVPADLWKKIKANKATIPREKPSTSSSPPPWPTGRPPYPGACGHASSLPVDLPPYAATPP